MVAHPSATKGSKTNVFGTSVMQIELNQRRTEGFTLSIIPHLGRALQALLVAAMLIACSPSQTTTIAPHEPLNLTPSDELDNDPKSEPVVSTNDPKNDNTSSAQQGRKSNKSITHTITGALVPREKTRAVVLAYHDFDRPSNRFSLPTDFLDRHIAWLKSEGIDIIPLSTLVDFFEGNNQLPSRVAVITIDDGYRSAYTKAFPILKKHNVPFTLGIPTRKIKEQSKGGLLGWDQIREMRDSGLAEIASHGHGHRNVAHISAQLRTEEIELSRKILAEHLGEEPTIFFYPLGAHNPVSEAHTKKAGYRAAFHAYSGAVAVGRTSAFKLPRTALSQGHGVQSLALFFGKYYLR